MIINVQYKPKTQLLRKKLMETLIMNDAADIIIKIFRLYIIRMKYHQTKLAVTRRYSKNTQSSVTGYSYRSFGSNESWNSGSGKCNNLNGGANQLRKRSDNSFSSSNSNDKKSQNSASKSSKYFTTKNFKGFASKLLYGKPKSPLDMKGTTNKESSKILQRGHDEFNSVEYDNREYHESLKSGRPRKCSSSKIDKLNDHLLINSDTSSPPSKTINNAIIKLKDLKIDNSPTSTSTSNLIENASDGNLRKNGGDITPKQNTMKLVGKSLSTSAISHIKPQLITQSSSISATSTATSTSISTSSSSFFSIHENRTKMNKELKDKSKTNHKAMKALRKEKLMRAKEDSYVLVAQKAYCLISSEEMQSSQFQVITVDCLFLSFFIFSCF